MGFTMAVSFNLFLDWLCVRAHACVFVFNVQPTGKVIWRIGS